MPRKITLFIAMPVVLISFQCAGLRQLAQITKPDVDVAGVRITALSLEKVDLAFDLDVSNPNALSINMAGFDYDLHLNKNSFVRGEQNNPLHIQGSGASRLVIPVSLTFQEIYQTYHSLKAKDSTEYQIHCGLSFNLPVFGATRIPVSKSGHLPLVKIPQISVSALKIEKLSFTGADLALELSVDNPNVFQVLMNTLNYSLKVNGSQWATGNTMQVGRVDAKNKGILRLPVSLNLMEMGGTVYQIVAGKQRVNFDLSGDFNFDTSNALLKNVTLPLNASGVLKIGT